MNLLLNMLLGNMIRRTDSYKIGHPDLYRPDQETIYSYLESRGIGSHFPVQENNGANIGIASFGYQYILKTYLVGKALTIDHIDEADDYYGKHFTYKDRKVFSRERWTDLLKKHDGRLPLSIRVAPEGMTLPPRNVMMTVRNTDKQFPWLTNFLETHLTQVWYPCTVATQSREFFKAGLAFLYKTGTPANIFFMLHDFGVRGVSCMEEAGIGGMSHTTTFMGTDNCPSLGFARHIYGEPMSGFSINATEHSNMSSWDLENAPAGEPAAIERLLELNPTGPIACVTDTYQIYTACRDLWGDRFKDKVKSRNGVLVVRPDSSGITKDGTNEDQATVVLNCLNILYEAYGGEVNAKGYRVMDSHIRIILGDGVDYSVFVDVLRRLMNAGWSADNIAFGSGGALLRKLDRDSLKFAFKASYGEAGGVGYDIWKDPFHVGKRSKRGLLKLIRKEGAHGSSYHTAYQHEDGDDLLVESFRDGELTHEFEYKDIRARMLPHPREVDAKARNLNLPAITGEEWGCGEYAGTSQSA